jgi:hypothetical protein
MEARFWTYEQFHAKAQSTQRPQREAERNSFVSFAHFAYFAPLRETLCLSAEDVGHAQPSGRGWRAISRVRDAGQVRGRLRCLNFKYLGVRHESLGLVVPPSAK